MKPKAMSEDGAYSFLIAEPEPTEGEDGVGEGAGAGVGTGVGVEGTFGVTAPSTRPKLLRTGGGGVA